MLFRNLYCPSHKSVSCELFLFLSQLPSLLTDWSHPVGNPHEAHLLDPDILQPRAARRVGAGCFVLECTILRIPLFLYQREETSQLSSASWKVRTYIMYVCTCLCVSSVFVFFFAAILIVRPSLPWFSLYHLQCSCCWCWCITIACGPLHGWDGASSLWRQSCKTG